MKDANASIVLVVEDNVFLREDIAHEFMEEGWAVLFLAAGVRFVAPGQRLIRVGSS
jgi:hypothetical protein